MAIIYARASGTWSEVLEPLPRPPDIVVSNGFRVIVDGNYTVLQATNINGGTFELASGSSLTCTRESAGVLGAAQVAAVTIRAGRARLVANVQGGAAALHCGLELAGGELEFIGSIEGGSHPQAYGIYLTGNGKMTGSNGAKGGVTGGIGAAMSETLGADTSIVLGSIPSPVSVINTGFALQNGIILINGDVTITKPYSITIPNTATAIVNNVTR